VALPATANASVPDVVSRPVPEQASLNCRNFTMPVLVDGQQRQAVGLLCQQPDGSWRVIQNTPGLPLQVYTLPAQLIYIAPNPYQYYWTNSWGFGPPFFAGGCCIFGRGFHHFHRGFFHGGFHQGFRHGFHGGSHGGFHGGHGGGHGHR
jgi:hypothetical protein